MTTNKIKTNAAMVLNIFLVVTAGITWAVTDNINEHLNTKEIKRLPDKKVSQEKFDIQNLFPVWIKSSRSEKMESNSDSIDELFKTKQETIVTTQSEPDYQNLLETKMKLDGLGSNGAFITGKFYRIGEPIYDYQYPLKGKQIIPTIAEIQEKSVIIKHGEKTTKIKL